MAEQDERTEEPTAKRRSQAREKGQVGKSTDLSSSVILVVAALVLWFYGEVLGGKLLVMTREVFQSFPGTTLDLNDFVHYFRMGFGFFFFFLAPLLSVLLAVGVLVSGLQVGFLFTFHPLKPNFLKIFSIESFKKLVSVDKLVDLVKSVMKMMVVGWVGAHVVQSHYTEYLYLADQSLAAIIDLIFSVLIEVMIKCGLLLLLLGIADLLYQKHKTKKSIKMTKQEVKDEAKQTDGDPQIKGKIRNLRLEMHRRMMMTEVPKATVVVTNPVHIAIAIQFRRGVDPAPRILAKGKRKIAEKIKKIAEEYDIPIVENKPLARSMFDVVIIGEEIPEEFFGPVAEILAYVYRLKSRDHEFESV